MVVREKVVMRVAKLQSAEAKSLAEEPPAASAKPSPTAARR